MVFSGKVNVKRRINLANIYMIFPGTGYPMGNTASRDALDLDLVRSEFEILSCNHQYIHASFTSVVKTIILMSRRYPTMPLNIQYSFCYSRFLDVHLYNILEVQASTYVL